MQACLGEIQKEKGQESVCLYVNIDNQKFVLGTLSSEKFPQLSFDLVFEKTFELSHNWKNGSIHFCGYKAVNPVEYPFYGSFLTFRYSSCSFAIIMSLIRRTSGSMF